ncbi:hypothetical protein [Paenibacillus tyrfis]|uniref:hypothetical protein n=1 Tax=Paenibacillus tyrfis TaxID=1501230 RepID=UPI00209EAC8B|nr:hypothetical protein [Paenibacillus tyrfis]MCP1312104.1 hypothetical protein [Paenibacillus tyrfis]
MQLLRGQGGPDERQRLQPGTERIPACQSAQLIRDYGVRTAASSQPGTGRIPACRSAQLIRDYSTRTAASSQPGTGRIPACRSAQLIRDYSIRTAASSQPGTGRIPACRSAQLIRDYSIRTAASSCSRGRDGSRRAGRCGCLAATSVRTAARPKALGGLALQGFLCIFLESVITAKTVKRYFCVIVFVFGCAADVVTGCRA